MENSTGNLVEDNFLAVHVECVTGIIASLVTDNKIRGLGENVNPFAFALVAPLGAYQNGYLRRMCHMDTTPLVGALFVAAVVQVVYRLGSDCGCEVRGSRLY
jgi:hypothetical protein